MAYNQRKRGNSKNSAPKFGGVKRNFSKKKKERKPMNPTARKILTVFCILFAIGTVCATVACPVRRQMQQEAMRISSALWSIEERS